MRKKILSLALIAAMATTMLAGCGGSKEAGEDATKAGSDAKVEISLGIWPGEDLVDDIPVFEGYQKTMSEKFPNVTVTPASYTYATDTFVSLAESGNCPTIFETWYTEPKKLAKQGLIADITEEVKKRGWEGQMTEAAASVMTLDDKLYGIPRDAYALGIMCNVELFEEAGLVDENGVPKFPKTWEELAETAKTIKEKTNAPGFCLLAKDNAGGWHFSNIAWCFGATTENPLCIENEDGTYKANLNSDAAIAAMEYVKDLKWKYDVLTADPMSEDWGTGFQQLAAGGAAMYIAANDAVNQPTQTYGLPVDKLAMCAIPAGPNGDQYSLGGGTPYCFAKDATPDQINACLDFLEIMGKTPEVNDTLKAGLQADAANRKNNGVPVVKPFPVWNNDELSKVQEEVIAEYQNVKPEMFDSYFETASKNLRTEEPGDTQNMYAELTKVLQAVLTDEKADVKALMNAANDNYQKMLDQLNK